MFCSPERLPAPPKRKVLVRTTVSGLVFVQSGRGGVGRCSLKNDKKTLLFKMKDYNNKHYDEFRFGLRRNLA